MQSNRFADQGLRQVAAPCLLSEDAEKMQAIEVVLISREDFPVALLSLAEPTSLMVLYSLTQ